MIPLFRVMSPFLNGHGDSRHVCTSRRFRISMTRDVFLAAPVVDVFASMSESDFPNRPCYGPCSAALCASALGTIR